MYSYIYNKMILPVLDACAEWYQSNTAVLIFFLKSEIMYKSTWLKTKLWSRCKFVNRCAAIDYFLCMENIVHVNLLELSLCDMWEWISFALNRSRTSSHHRRRVWEGVVYGSVERQGIQCTTQASEPCGPVYDRGVCVCVSPYFCSVPALRHVIKLE